MAAKINDYPHRPAAFISAIAEEGTKDEAIEWLQKQWNENCSLRAEIAQARQLLLEAPAFMLSPDSEARNRWMREAHEWLRVPVSGKA